MAVYHLWETLHYCSSFTAPCRLELVAALPRSEAKSHIYILTVEPILPYNALICPHHFFAYSILTLLSEMADCRVAFFGQESAIEHFLEIVPRHRLLSLDNLSKLGPEAFRDAIRTYHITVLMYFDQDPDALLWAHNQIRQHRTWHGASLLVLAPVVEEHQDGQPTILQEAPVAIGNPDHAFQLLKVIATAIEPRTVTAASSANPLSSPLYAARSRPSTPKAPRHHRSRTQLRHSPSQSQQLKDSPMMQIPRWRELQEILKVKQLALGLSIH